jgi:hypothetical protein
MPRSVIITTPMPTLEEFGKRLGLSKRRQQALLRLMGRDVVSGELLPKSSRNGTGNSKGKKQVPGSTK